MTTTTSTGHALTLAGTLTLVVIGLLGAWTAGYARAAQR
jgi:hypothetical protein